jgi:hypothetical protein
MIFIGSVANISRLASTASYLGNALGVYNAAHTEMTLVGYEIENGMAI